MPPSEPSGFHRFLKRWVRVEPSEIGAVVLAFVYFFSLLCTNYILRPIREEMGIAGGVDNLQWLFTGTFVAMLTLVPLFGWVAARYPRKQFLPYVYYFFLANILIFYALFTSDIKHAYVARAFFIWLSVFNLFVVSVFWSFMADIFSDRQAKRLFGFIAGGGTIGALTGPVLTASLVGIIGVNNLLLIAAGLLALPVLCIQGLARWTKKSGIDRDPQKEAESDRPMGGSIFAGIPLVLRSPYLLGIGALILLYSTLATFLYFEQAALVENAFSEPEQRVALFAGIDFSTNAITILVQVFLTARIVERLGLAWTLALIPLGVAVGFLVLGLAPVLGVLVVMQVLRRAGNFSLTKPAREMLYVVLGKEEKYKAKNFIDTVVYRGGDAVSAWAYTGLRAIGVSLAGVAFVAVPLAGIWAWVSFRLGRRNTELVAAKRLRFKDHSRGIRHERFTARNDKT
ncbi:MAG: MFS transporter [Bacteroidetes bacterium]|nr:MFS transporter [Bacteroidota bacterium]